MVTDDSCESGMRNWENGDAICPTRQWRRSQVRYEMSEGHIDWTAGFLGLSSERG